MANQDAYLITALIVIVLVVIVKMYTKTPTPDMAASHFRSKSFEQSFEFEDVVEEVPAKLACSVSEMYPKREMLPTCKQDCRVTCR